MKLDATSLSTAPGEKAHVKLAFVSEDRIASFSGEADVDPTAPAATGRFELAKFSLGLLFPYYSEVLDVDVQKGSLDLAARFSVDTGGNLTLSDGVGTISELSLALPGNRSPLWRVPTLTATGVDVDVRARKVTFGELKSHSPSLRIVRERDGSLEFARVLKTGQAKARTDRRGVDDRDDQGLDRARRHRLRGPRADARGEARDPRRRSSRQRPVERARREIAGQAQRAHRRARADGLRGTGRDPAAVAVRHAGGVGTRPGRVEALFRARSQRRHHRRRTGGERTGRAGRSRRRCGARLVERRDEGHRLRLVRQADVVRSCTLEIAGGRGHGHRERTVPRRHRSHRPRGLLRARHRLSGRHDQYRQAGNAGGEPGTRARCEAGAACRARRAERSAAGVDRPHRAGARQRGLLRSVREAELLGQPHRRRGQRLGDVGQTGR